MEQANICIRINKSVKEKFDKICDELGLSMSTALNMFIKTVVREESIPLNLSLHIPNAETIKAIEEVERGEVFGPYDSVDEAMKAMLKDE